MNWDDLRHFSALAAARSLSAAARQLGVEHATVARRIAALEDHLGLALVDRRGRRWRLTPDGERIAAIAERMEHEARGVQRAADGARQDLSGVVTISAPPMLAAGLLAAPLVALQKAHPGLTLRLIGEARTASLERSEADIAIRLSRPEGGDLTLSKLGRLEFKLFASPDYLAETLEKDWRFIGFDASMSGAPQQAALKAYAKGRPFAFEASSLEIQQAAARAGAGIVALPDFMGAAEPGLVAIRPDETLIHRDIWLVIHEDLKRSAPVKAVSQRLREVFRAL